MTVLHWPREMDLIRPRLIHIDVRPGLSKDKKHVFPELYRLYMYSFYLYAFKSSPVLATTLDCRARDEHLHVMFFCKLQTRCVIGTSLLLVWAHSSFVLATSGLTLSPRPSATLQLLLHPRPKYVANML